MKVKRVPIESVSFDPANVRIHDEAGIAVVAGSLRRFGQQTPIVIDGSNIVRKGNGTLAAAKLLEWTHIDAVQTELTGPEATAYSIADNRTQEFSSWDDASLKAQLRSLNDADEELFSVLGFDLSYLETLQEESVEPPTEFSSYDENLETEFKCPACQHEWSGQPKPGQDG